MTDRRLNNIKPNLLIPRRFCLLLLIAYALGLGIVDLSAANWTILVYMAADNGLNDNAVEDINEMESATFPSSINVIVQIDESAFSSSPGARRYKIHHDEEPGVVTSPVLQDLGEIDSGDYHELADFAIWGFNRYPSSHRMLVLWSHGNSWYKGNGEKWICTDNPSHSAIDVWNGELKSAISSIPKTDILLFDACSMQALEVVNEVYRNCDYIIGSEDLVPVTGFPYQDILNSMPANIDPDELAAIIPQLYVESYSPLGSQNPELQPIPVSCSYAVCSEFPAFRQELDAFASTWNVEAQQFVSIREQLLNFNDMQADVDFNDFMMKASVAGLPELNSLQGDALQLQSAFLEVFPQQFNNEYTDVQAGYATIWFPPISDIFEGLWQRYGYLDLAETAWSGFLNSYVGPDSIPPLKPKITNVHQELHHLYISWEAPPDPGVLKYDVLFGDESQPVSGTVFITETTYAAHVYNNEYNTIYLYARDEAGNRSTPDKVQFTYKTPSTQMYFAPNPVRDIKQAKLHLLVPLQNPEYTVRIYDITGKMLFEKKLWVNPHIPPKNEMDDEVVDENIIELSKWNELEKLSSGVYEVILTGKGVTLRTKLVIAK